MEESNDVQALEKISSEVDESQIKVILSSQCIKAQAFLLDKLRKQSDRHKETCGFINSANLKVETELKQAEQEIRSLLIAQETLKSANVEIRKDLLLAKNRKADIIERVKDGKNKYEALWLECKARYESIPFVQKLLQAQEKQKASHQDILNLDEQITNLYVDIEKRRNDCVIVDKNRCIELANFMINEMPKAVAIIKEKSDMIKVMTAEIEQVQKELQENVGVTVTANVTDSLNLVKNTLIQDEVKEDLNLSKNEDDPLIPRLNLVNFDLDITDINFDQVKIKKNEILNTITSQTSPALHNYEKIVEQRLEKENTYEYMISPYFKPYKEEKSRNFSDRKLINILEDIKIDDGEVYNIVKNVNPDQLRAVGDITAETVENTVPKSNLKDKDDKLVSDNIEEIDLTSSIVEQIIIPPTQFLDISLSDDVTRKRVSFDLPSSVQINEIIDEDKQDGDEVMESVDQTANSQLDVSAASDESYIRIKEMLLKKHNLDLSPQFVYSKNNVLQKNEDKIVTSIFFQNRNIEHNVIERSVMAMEVDKPLGVEEVVKSQKSQKDEDKALSQSDHKLDILMPMALSQSDQKLDILMPMDLDEVVVSSPKPMSPVGLEASFPSREQTPRQTHKTQEVKPYKPITGLLFTHGSQAIPDSLDVSLSTTGYEDSDFPHCIDSSLLLSPKADVPASGDNHEGMSQDVPNFLSGFRKTGLSFFGGPSTSSDHKPGSITENEGSNNFNFNFGGEKKRGGLFSLFH